MGTSSMYGTRVEEDLRERMYVRRCTVGSRVGSSVIWPGRGCSGFGRGESWTEMTCSMPANEMESIASPLKSAMRCCFSWMKRGWVSKRGEAKCMRGLCPGVDFGVCREGGWSDGN